MTYKGTIGKITVKNEHDVEWKINDIFSYTGENQCYNSPSFRLSNCEWKFSIYPNGKTGSEQWISLYLSLYGCPSKGATFHCGVKKCDGKVDKIRSSISWIFQNSVIDCRYDGYLKRSELAERKSELAPSDTFTVTCNLREYDDFDSTARTNNLSNDFLSMFTSQTACDVILHVKQEKFSVHKFVLMARSSVFAAMFETPMKERTTGVVDIEDCDPQAFRDFLVYLYSGRLEKLSRHRFELYKIADKYNVKDLKSDCLIAMMGNLSVENVCDTMSLAEKSNEKELKQKVEKFFNENYAKIFLTSEWETFMIKEQKLANGLLINMAKHLKK